MAPILTIAVAPSVTTQAATDVTSSAATGNGTIVALGSPSDGPRRRLEHDGFADLGGCPTNEGAATSAGPFSSVTHGVESQYALLRPGLRDERRDDGLRRQVTFTSLQTFTFAYTAGAGGTITGARFRRSIRRKRSPVTASPDANYHFVSWSDDVLTDTRTDTNVTADLASRRRSLPTRHPSGAALIALYNATGGDFWTNNSGWKAAPLYSDDFAMPGTEGTWFGVSGAGGHITGIASRPTISSGALPTAIGDLSI